MRDFLPDEQMLPYQPSPAGESQEMPPLAGALLGLLFVAAGIWLAQTALLFGILFGLPGAIFLVVIAGQSFPAVRRFVKPIAFGGSVFLLAAVGLLYWGDGSLGAAALVWLFLGLVLCLFVLIGLRAIQDRRIAAIMAEVRASAPRQDVGPAAERVDAPALNLRVYEYGELPPLSGPYQAPVTAERNIAGVAPFRILYLYNFYASGSLISKVRGDWRRFGPVHYLGSPADISLRHTFDIRIAKDVQAMLLTSPPAFDAKLAAADEAPLPPGHDALKGGLAYFTGGYPQHQFLCGDGCWQHGFERLLERADLILLDAAMYIPARAGLGWEIGQVIDRVPSDRVIVLMDEETDRVALAEALRGAWSRMAPHSPNEAAGQNVIRMVHMTRPRKRPPGEPGEMLPRELDAAGLFAKAGAFTRAYMTGLYNDLLVSDGTLALALPFLSRPDRR